MSVPRREIRAGSPAWGCSGGHRASRSESEYESVDRRSDRAEGSRGPGVEQRGIELGLFAPYNERVELIGSWDDFKPLALSRDEHGWWRTRVALPDGEYRYKFRVTSNSYFARGETLEVFDPYGISVTDDGREMSVLRIEAGRRNEFSYTWKHDHVPLPPNDQLVIYEMHVGDFTAGSAAGTARSGRRASSATRSTSSTTSWSSA
jgi:1,4-alpha-glucan branching enzyme